MEGLENISGFLRNVKCLGEELGYQLRLNDPSNSGGRSTEEIENNEYISPQEIYGEALKRVRIGRKRNNGSAPLITAERTTGRNGGVDSGQSNGKPKRYFGESGRNKTEVNKYPTDAFNEKYGTIIKKQTVDDAQGNLERAPQLESSHIGAASSNIEPQSVDNVKEGPKEAPKTETLNDPPISGGRSTNR